MLVHSTGIARNKLVCRYANIVYTSQIIPYTHTHTHTHTHILIPFEDCELTGLKVDIAYCTQSILSGIHCQVFFMLLIFISFCTGAAILCPFFRSYKVVTASKKPP